MKERRKVEKVQSLKCCKKIKSNLRGRGISEMKWIERKEEEKGDGGSRWRNLALLHEINIEKCQEYRWKDS